MTRNLRTTSMNCLLKGRRSLCMVAMERWVYKTPYIYYCNYMYLFSFSIAIFSQTKLKPESSVHMHHGFKADLVSN